jgi:adenylyl- and sulfurtransferase ThiI
MNVSSEINEGSREETISSAHKRITVTISAATAKHLTMRSLAEGRSLSNLAAYILEQALASDSQD